MVTIGQFLLRFRLVERVMTHRHAGDGESHEAEELRDNVPQMRWLLTISVILNDPACHHAHQGETEKHFVAQGLRGSTHRPSSEYLLLLDQPANSTA